MSSQDPIGSTIPPERPRNPTHFGGDGLYELEGEQGSRRTVWNFAKRNHVPALLAIGGIAWLLAILVRRSTER